MIEAHKHYLPENIQLVVSDLNDTLTDTGQPISRAMARAISNLLEAVDFCVVTGSGFVDVKRQVIDRLHLDDDKKKRLYFITTTGSVLYAFSDGDWQQIYKMELSAQDRKKIKKVLAQSAKELGLMEETVDGEYIQDRVTQVTFSALGDKASIEKKIAWDIDGKKKSAMRSLVAKRLPGFSVAMNNKTSIDVSAKNVDKAYGVQRLLDITGHKKDEVLFFGRSLLEGGNDWSMTKLGISLVTVPSWYETLQMMTSLPRYLGDSSEHNEGPLVTATIIASRKIPERLLSMVNGIALIVAGSRESLFEQVQSFIPHTDYESIEFTNTAAGLYKFYIGRKQYALKIEFGENTAVANEAHWYNKVPSKLRRHILCSSVGANHAFIVMEWLKDVRSVEEFAMDHANTNTGMSAVDYLLRALSYDEEIFESYHTIPLAIATDHSFFRDKFYTKLEQAKMYPYLYELLVSDQVMINGIAYEGPKRLVEKIHTNIALLRYLSPDKAGFIHGDLHADNILCRGRAVYFVDPNGIDHLPIEYDHGRVIWSLTGWNAVARRGEHDIKRTAVNSYDLSVPIRPVYRSEERKVIAYFAGYDKRKGLQPGQSYHRAIYSAAMQYLTRTDHGSVADEASALVLQGVRMLHELVESLSTIRPSTTKRVIVSGYFNPLHQGHLNIIEEAKAMGDYLIVIVNNDKQQLLKKGKIIMSEDARVRVVSALGEVDEVVLSIDNDPPIAKTLGSIARRYPDDELIFANGGDRNAQDNPIPAVEHTVQKKYGIKLLFGVGGYNKADSSSRINESRGEE